MIKLNLVLSVSLLGALLLVNAVSNLLIKDPNNISSNNFATPYGLIYVK